MLISLKKTHKEHLKYLTLQPVQILEDFCKLASEFLINGPKIEQYNQISKRLNVVSEVIENCVYGLVQLLLLGCKHKLSEADFRDSVLTLGFSPEQQSVISNLYSTKQSDIHEVLKVPIDEHHFDDLRWRFEAQIASRSLVQSAVPIITMEITTSTSKNGFSENKQRMLVQTDPNNLLHIVNELEKALGQSKSRHSRKIERVLKN